MKFMKTIVPSLFCFISIFSYSMNDGPNQSSARTISIYELPDHILQTIASFCHDYAALVMRSTCKTMRQHFSFSPDGIPLYLQGPAQPQALISLIACFPRWQSFALHGNVKKYRVQHIARDLNKLPKEVAARIVVLDLSSMGLKELPKSLHCFWINRLLLANNKLTLRGCDYLKKFVNLRYLSLKGNPFKDDEVQTLRTTYPAVTILF